MLHITLPLMKPEALHIPDGFLSVPVAAVGWLLAVICIAYALRQTQLHLGERQIPLLGVLAAFIFAAQAINFPVVGGTSGHLLGGALAAIVLGPWSAVLVMTAVVGMQALLFQDGGLLAMGWNIVNMGVLTVLIAMLVYRLVRWIPLPDRIGIIVAGLLSAWFSVQVAAVATSMQLAASGTADFTIVLTAMMLVHALIGLGEALITIGALIVIVRVRPALLNSRDVGSGKTTASWVGAGLLLAIVVALFSFMASPSPDGLERVAEDMAFLNRALDPLFRILPDYTIPGLGNDAISGVLAVTLGTLLVFILLNLAVRLVRRTKTG